MPNELLSMQDPHGEAGYFRLDGVELSRAECYAIDAVAQAVFLASHELLKGGGLTETINELTPPQLTKLRGRALAIAAGSLVDGHQGKVPVELDGDGPATTYAVRSHRRKPPGGAPNG